MAGNTKIDEIRVVWPIGPDTIIRDVPANRLMRITQDAPIGAVGRIAAIDHREQTIHLGHTYTDPVVFVQPISKRGSDFAIPRITPSKRIASPCACRSRKTSMACISPRNT
ncbi:MAG: hypothetical protein HC834_10525 [Rhodospirillales bacterium]|nr:hypothetical protein [Rhodospirillales bacterium]